MTQEQLQECLVQFRLDMIEKLNDVWALNKILVKHAFHAAF